MLLTVSLSVKSLFSLYLDLCFSVFEFFGLYALEWNQLVPPSPTGYSWDIPPSNLNSKLLKFNNLSTWLSII